MLAWTHLGKVPDEWKDWGRLSLLSLDLGSHEDGGVSGKPLMSFATSACHRYIVS